MKRLLLLAALITVLSPLPAAFAQERAVTVDELEQTPEDFSCVETAVCPQVTLQGELIGDYGTRGDGTVWVQLNDDPYARNPLLDGGGLAGGNRGIGLHGPAGLFADLDPPGRYERRGPVVEVSGEFLYHDPDKGGETYIEVELLTVIQTGRMLGEPSELWAALTGLGLLAVSLGALAAVLRRRRPA